MIKYRCGLATAGTNQKEVIQNERHKKSSTHKMELQIPHVICAPKSRRQVFYGEKKREICEILRRLCEWKGVTILEAECCTDHVHMLLEIPPKMSVSGFMG